MFERNSGKEMARALCEESPGLWPEEINGYTQF